MKGSKGETDSNIQGSSDKAMSWFLNRNTTSQKGLTWNIPSNDKQKPANKNTLFSMDLIWNGRWNKVFLDLKNG